MNLDVLKHPDRYIKKISNYKLSFIIHPRVLNSSDFVYPYNSFVIYDEDEENIIPSKSLPIFHNVNTSWIFNFFDVADDVNIEDNSGCKSKKINHASIIKKNIPRNSDYDVYLPGKHVKWSKELARHNPLILSYNLYTEAHTCRDNYKVTMSKVVNKFYSKLMLIHKLEHDNIYLNDEDKITMKELVRIRENIFKNNDGLYFMYFKLPRALPPFNTYWNYKDKVLNTGLFKYMTSQDRMELFLLFKLISSAGDNTPYDIFNYLNLEELGKLHIVFELDNKITTTPLYFLVGLIKDIDMPDFINLKNPKYDRHIVTKILYKHLLEIYKSPSFNLTDVLNNNFISSIAANTGDTADSIEDMSEKEFEQEMDDLDNDSVELDDTIDLSDVDVESESGDIIEEVSDSIDIKRNSIINPNRKDSDLTKDLETIKESIENMPHKALKKKAAKAKKELENLENSTIEVNGEKIPLKDYLNLNKEDIELSDDDVMMPDSKVVFDKDYLKNPINAFDEKYITKVYHKDAIRTIVSLSRAGFIPKKIEILKEENVLGDSNIYNVEYVDLTGKSHKLTYKVPIIRPDGTFQLSGNTYRSRKTRMDAPIKKLTWNRVMLSSAYGKIFVEKAPLKKYDVGYKLKKYIAKLTDDGVYKNVIFGSILTVDVDYPTDYSLFGRYTKSFFYKRNFFIFDYNSRKEIAYNLGLTSKDLETYEKDKIFIGYTIKKEAIFIDYENNLHILRGKKLVKEQKLMEFLNIDTSVFGIEFAMVKIVKKYVPIAILLIYHLGLKNLLDVLKAKYKIEDKGTRDDNILSIKFADKYLNIEIATPLQKMILVSLTEYKKYFKSITINTLEDSTALSAFLMDLDYTINIISEIKTLGPLFVDPITANILELMKEPTTFTGLLIRAAEMLLNDDFSHPSDTNGYRFRGYDKIHTLTYKLMVDGVKKKMGEDYFASGKLSINPFEIEKQINSDSTSVLLDDLNPISYIKQKEDTTYLGIGGRKKESMSKNTRVFHPNDTGVISEAVKDSGDVGVTAYLSGSPLIKNLRGEKDVSKKPKFVNMLSTPGLLLPFPTHDDSKRANFTQIQMAHLVPISGAQAFPVRTGYDALIGYKLPKKYIGFAKEEGKVEIVSGSEVKIKYKSGEKDIFPLTSWYSKEESFSTFKFDLVANVKKGDKLEKGQIITYCPQWFEPDMFDKKRVTFKQGIIVKTALQEIMETYEDSCAITNKIVDKLVINPVKARSIVITKDDRIANPMSLGDEVTPSSTLLTILGEIEGIEDKPLTKEDLELLQNFVRETPKAKYEGKIVKIRLYYNCKKSELNPTLKRLLTKVGDIVVDNDTGKSYSGEVNSSYSIKGRPLQEGDVEIKYYIQTTDIPTTGDKFVFGNQLKCTVGEVYAYPIKTENGEEIEALFSTKSIVARIVTSYMTGSTTTTLLKKVTENVVDMYFNK